MSEINEKEIKRRFEAISQFEASREVTARDLEQTRKSLAGKISTRQPAESKIWRTIMKSNITKLAAAAVIIIAILLTLNNSSVDIASNVYAEITENMQKMPWVHVRFTIEQSGEEGNLWYSDKEQVRVIKGHFGFIEFCDYQKEKRYVYNPDTKSISVSSINQADYSKSVINMQNGIDSLLTIFSQKGAVINHYTGEFEGEEVEIYEVQHESGNDGKIYVSPENRLPIYGEFIETLPSNQVIIQVHWEFPESGPRDIYDVGVPKDAQIIENLPGE